jgi:chromate transporter
MMSPSAPISLTAQLALLSAISFGGFPTVLPDVRAFVVTAHGWMTDQDFANIFAMAQAIPGPNMILMIGLVGWKVWGLPGAIASSTATFAPPCAIYFAAFRLWDRFRDAGWQRSVRTGLAPVTVGLIMASGIVMGRAADTSWPAVAMSIAAFGLLLTTRLNPIWLLAAGGMLGGLGVL